MPRDLWGSLGDRRVIPRASPWDPHKTLVYPLGMPRGLAHAVLEALGLELPPWNHYSTLLVGPFVESLSCWLQMGTMGWQIHGTLYQNKQPARVIPLACATILLIAVRGTSAIERNPPSSNHQNNL